MADHRNVPECEYLARAGVAPSPDVHPGDLVTICTAAVIYRVKVVRRDGDRKPLAVVLATAGMTPGDSWTKGVLYEVAMGHVTLFGDAPVQTDLLELLEAES